MAIAQETHGSVYAGSSALMMARVESADGAVLTPGEIGSIEYTISEFDPCRPGTPDVVPGHDSVDLAVGDVLTGSLQTGGAWTIDAEGYNFRHEIDVLINAAFPEIGLDYRVRYTLRPVVGQPILISFLLRAL